MALKTRAPGVQHKSDVGGVLLGLGDAQDVDDAWHDTAERIGAEVTVPAMAPPGLCPPAPRCISAGFAPCAIAWASGCCTTT